MGFGRCRTCHRITAKLWRVWIAKLDQQQKGFFISFSWASHTGFNWWNFRREGRGRYCGHRKWSGGPVLRWFACSVWPGRSCVGEPWHSWWSCPLLQHQRIPLRFRAFTIFRSFIAWTTGQSLSASKFCQSLPQLLYFLNICNVPQHGAHNERVVENVL